MNCSIYVTWRYLMEENNIMQQNIIIILISSSSLGPSTLLTGRFVLGTTLTSQYTYSTDLPASKVAQLQCWARESGKIYE